MILELTLVGNPTMHHLVLGIDPTAAGPVEPFPLVIDKAALTPVPARELEPDRRTIPARTAYVLPCIAGHVGADARRRGNPGPGARTPRRRDDPGRSMSAPMRRSCSATSDRLIACLVSPTGPAFEGAQITCGQRAAPGAIERVRIDAGNPEAALQGSSAPSSGPTRTDFEEAIAETGVTGICGSGIIEALAEMFLAGILTADGVIDGAVAARAARVREDGRTFAYLIREGGEAGIEIRITQNDVRAIQLAKAALYAGARLLMDTLGVDTVERIVLAGAFGSHIDTKYAMVLGMIPDCRLEHVSSAGNAAGTGARVALLNQAARGEIERVVRDIEKVETAVEPRFQEHFIEAMAFPHKSAPYPHLAAVVELPEPVEAPMPRRSPRQTQAAAQRLIGACGDSGFAASSGPHVHRDSCSRSCPPRRSC